MTTRISICAFVGVLVLSGPVFGNPNSTQPIDKKWEICAQAVSAVERQTNIPKHLLGAISQAESGRWHPKKRANIAWPWTVTANGKGQFFDSKEEAQAEAEILLTQGVRNIDVGCMQVNLKYHADAFETLSQAFDPAANARYAAKYLRAMHSKTKDWRQAAAHYHSTTPALAARYKAKVLRLWNKARGHKPSLLEIAKSTPTPPTETNPEITPDRDRPANIDFGLMNRLNSAYRKRKTESVGNELADKAAHKAHQRREQLDAWRRHQMGGMNMMHLANMRRAELAQRRSKQINRVSSADRAQAFAERRKRDLAKWRQRRNDPHYSVY